jgi:aminoglycoside phosphotransferase
MSTGTDHRPVESDAAAIACAFTAEPTRSVARFAMGIAHYVYDVVTASGRSLVVRIGTPADEAHFAGAVYWSNLLRPIGVPLPALLQAGTHAGMPYIVLERLPGADLGLVYAGLTANEKRVIAAEVVRIQSAVRRLPEGRGYGFVNHQGGPFPHRTWAGVVHASLARSRAWFHAAQLLDTDSVARVERSAERFDRYFAQVRPQAFLDDTTTKNVIVHQGRVSGIVDVDAVCFGDPLYTLALTRVALLNDGQIPDYVDHWCDLLDLTAEQRGALRFYTALFCVVLLSEFGHRFNRTRALPLDAVRLSRLTTALDEQLAEA